MTRKVLAMLLAMAMLLSMVIVPASANEQPESLTEQAQEVAAEEGAALPEEQPEALPKEEPLEESVQMPLLDVNALADKTVTLTMTPRKTEVTLENGVAYVVYDLFLQTSDAATPIEACAFNLTPRKAVGGGLQETSAMQLADTAGGDAQGFYYYCEADTLRAEDFNTYHDYYGHPYNLIDYTPSSGYFALAGYDKGGGGIANSQTKVMTIVAKFTESGTYQLTAANCIAGNGKLEGGDIQKFGTFNVVTAPVTVKKVTVPNVTAAASAQEVHKGETFTVTLSNKAMAVSTFTAGMSFLTTKLECTAIAPGAGYTALTGNASHVLPEMSTVTEANGNGKVGFGIVSGQVYSYEAAELMTVTFRANVEGQVQVVPYESSSGDDGFTGQGGAVYVTIVPAAVTHTHAMEEHPAVTPTADTEGNTAYWYCTECHKYFSNASGTNEITEGSWVLAALGDAFTVQLVPVDATLKALTSNQVCPGTTFGIAVYVANNTVDIGTLAADITYNSTVLQRVDYKKEGKKPTFYKTEQILGDSYSYNDTAGCLTVGILAGENPITAADTDEYPLFVVHFKVLEGAASGETSVGIRTSTRTDDTVWAQSNQTIITPVYEGCSMTAGHDYAITWSTDADNHWHECTICHEVQPNTQASHSFALKDNGDGTHSNVCSVCGYVEEGSTVAHSSDTWKHDANGHWKICSCGAKFAEADHTGTATCVAAATCSVCSTVFGDVDPINHVDTLGFTAAKAATCVAEGNVAYYTCEHCHKNFSDTAGTEVLNTVVKPIDPNNHTWDAGVVTPSTATARGSILYTCENDASHTKTELMPPYSSTDFRVSISSINKTYAGKTVSVTVSLTNNPGIASLQLAFQYDHSALTLTNIEEVGSMTGWETNLNTGKATWVKTADNANNGNILKLTFAIADNAPSTDYTVSVCYDNGNICNAQRESKVLTQEIGHIHVIDKIAGDVNNDCLINNVDAMVLMQYVVGLNPTGFDRSNGDYNHDGLVNNVDAMAIMQYVVGN